MAKPCIDALSCDRILFQRQNQREVDDAVVPESIEYRILAGVGKRIWGK